MGLNRGERGAGSLILTHERVGMEDTSGAETKPKTSTRRRSRVLQRRLWGRCEAFPGLQQLGGCLDGRPGLVHYLSLPLLHRTDARKVCSESGMC